MLMNITKKPTNIPREDIHQQNQTEYCSGGLHASSYCPQPRQRHMCGGVTGVTEDDGAQARNYAAREAAVTCHVSRAAQA